MSLTGGGADGGSGEVAQPRKNRVDNPISRYALFTGHLLETSIN
jgi:hypothetical protein